MRLDGVFGCCFIVSVDGRRRVKLLEIFRRLLSIKDHRHLAALRSSWRENRKSLKTGDFTNKRKSPAETREVREIHPPVLRSEPELRPGGRGWRGVGKGGTTGKAGAELCIHCAASGCSAKCAQLRRTGGAKLKKGARTRPHCGVNAGLNGGRKLRL